MAAAAGFGVTAAANFGVEPATADFGVTSAAAAGIVVVAGGASLAAIVAAAASVRAPCQAACPLWALPG